jgi:hypothetical protein
MIPAFAAVAAARAAYERFEGAMQFENYGVETGLREAIRELAATVPTMLAGLAAVTALHRELTCEIGDAFFQDRDAVVFAESLDRAVRGLMRKSASLATHINSTPVPVEEPSTASASEQDSREANNRAIIAADVRRFAHVINKDGVLGTHTRLTWSQGSEAQRWANCNQN